MKTKIGFKETLDWYEQNANKYAQKISDKSDMFLLNRFLKKIPEKSLILDAGCAAGRDCKIFAEKGYVPTGVDAVKSLLNEAKKNNPKLKFIQGNFTNLPFSNESFDGIWSQASLLHLEKMADVEKSLFEFFRVLKTGGFAHISVKKQLGKEKTSNAAQEYSEGFDRFFRWFNKNELTLLVEKAGFEIIKLDDDYTPKNGRKHIKWLAVLAKKS